MSKAESSMSDELKQAVPSPLALRDELEAMVLRQLLGPGTDYEEVIESPGTRYFVGVLAPRKRSQRADNDATASPSSPTALEGDQEPDEGGEHHDLS